jgi:hypothetical protein
LGAQAYNAESEVLVPISSTNTNRLGSSSFAIVTFQAHLKNSSRSSAPIVRFLREAQPLHQPPDGGVAKGRVSYVLQEAASLRDGGAWALLYVLFEENSGFLACLAGPSRALSGLKRPSFSGHSRVALDRGEAHVEQARRLSFGHATSYGGDYLLAEVFRISSHPAMIAYRPTFILNAVGTGKTSVWGSSSTGYGGRFEGSKAQLKLEPGRSTGKPTGAHSKGGDTDLLVICGLSRTLGDRRKSDRGSSL